MERRDDEPGILRLDRDVISLRPRMVLIQEGINDLKGIGLFTREEDAIVDECAEPGGDCVAAP